MRTSGGNGFVGDRASAVVVRARLPWMRVVELAREFQAARLEHGGIDPIAAARVARAVLDFQEQLLGGMVASATQRSELEQLEPRPTSESSSSSRTPWAHVVELAQRFEVVAARGGVHAEIATNLACAVLEFQEQLRGRPARTAHSVSDRNERPDTER
jgi:hypothetical protein